MRDLDLFEPFDQLIEIDVMGRRFQVPENNTIMRCLQYIELDAVSYGDFCWNGECINCQVWVESGDKEKPLLACRAKAFAGMKITRVDEAVEPAIETILATVD
jgi:NADH dehydrogenase/NADH:ubiquinone oxidoreductase subunit G